MSLRIGLVCHWAVGGSVKVAERLAVGLVEAGHTVHLFARARPFGLTEMPARDRLVLHSPFGHREGLTSRLDAEWSSVEMERMADLLVDVTRSERLQVLHFHYAVPFSFVFEEVASRLGPNPPVLVGTLHGSDVSVYGRERDIGPRIAHALTVLDAVTTVSRSHAALAAGVFGLSHQPIVIPNFVDLSRWVHPSRVAHGHRVSRSRPRIVHVSNFRPVKRSPTAASVFAAVRNCVDAELWLVGDGEEMPHVRSILDNARLGSDVFYFGLRRNVENIVREADLMLITSRSESFSLAALEALASGVPVVAPRVGGIPELVEDGISGVLFDPDDDEGAAAAVVRLLSDRERLAAMSRRARLRASCFSSATAVARYVDLYRALLSHGRPVRAGETAAIDA